MNLTELTQYAQNNDPKLIARVKDFLDRDDVQATKGAQRIAIVCENFKFLTFEQAYHLIDPDTFQEEFEETQSYKLFIRLLNYGRIILSLAPLILTWFALFSAANGYQNDFNQVSRRPNGSIPTTLAGWFSPYNIFYVLAYCAHRCHIALATAYK